MNHSAASYWISAHAARRMRDRDITIREVRAALTRPDQAYPCARTYPRAEHRRVVQGGRLGVIVDDGLREIVTVVFRDVREWIARGELNDETLRPSPA